MIGEDLINLYKKEQAIKEFSFDALFDHLIRKEIFISFDSEKDLEKFEYLADCFNYCLDGVDESTFSKCLICLFYKTRTYQFVEYAQTYTSHSRYRINFKDIEFLFKEKLKDFMKNNKDISISESYEDKLDYEINDQIILGKKELMPVSFDFYNKNLIELFKNEYGEPLNYEIRYRKIYIKEFTSYHFVKYYHTQQDIYYHDFINWIINYNHSLQIFNIKPVKLKEDVIRRLNYIVNHSLKDF